MQTPQAPRTPKLKIEIADATAIDAPFKHELYALFEKYYVDVSYERFERDLAEKTHILLLLDPDAGRIAGFSTVLRKRMPEVGRGVFLFSGDTVMHQDYWGNKALPIAFFRYIVSAKLRSPFEPLYWMLISKGFKTYLMMRRNFPLSFPNSSRPTPGRFKKVANGFYRRKFGPAYSPETDLIRFETSHGAVRGRIAAPCDADMGDPDIGYFAERNPHYSQGVELACVAEVRFRDFAYHFKKYFVADADKQAVARFKPAPSRKPAAGLRSGGEKATRPSRGAKPGKESSESAVRNIP